VLAPASLMSPSTSALTPVGPGAITVAPPTRTVQATIGGALGIFPGQWLKLLGPAAMQPQVSISDNETSVDQSKTQYNRVYRFDNRAVWASGGRFDLELYQLHQEAVTAQDHHKNAVQTLLQNRIVYRPIFSSPISLRMNYQDTRSLNVFDSSLSLPSWADQTLYQGILQWLMRWNQLLTTLSTFTFNITDTSNFLNKDPATLQVTVYSNRQYQVGPEEEFRFYPLREAATLYLYQRDGLFRWFGHGDGASNGISYYVAAGGIWRMGDKVYLDGGVQYDNLTCLSQPTAGSACLAVSRITPRLYLTVNL
jgi:hypothetical protein